MEFRKHLKNAGTLSVAVGVTAVLVVAARFMSASEIPLPFGFGTSGSPLAGNISQIGIKGGISVQKVTFPTGTDAETLGIDQLYLVQVPDDQAIATQALDDVFTVGQSHSVNYFGYKYTSVNATTEKANKNASLLTDRFPGQFFASAKARSEDPQHGNSISGFETANNLTMADTDTLSGATLERNSLYFIIVNEASGATLTVRTTVQSTCGDGAIEGTETCDDSNTTAGDGCSATCAVESGFVCSGEPSTCSAVVCGDGVKQGTEACDDSNTTAGDGCSATCTVESGFTCTGSAPSVCTQDPVCGNGTKEGSEACDDSNTTAGDGCSATCTVESGFACTGTAPSVCSGICGDGLIKGSETCDDQNTATGDGCSDVCAVESGFVCSGEPSTCSAVVCGDGQKQGTEACDDGDTDAGDGCSATCTVESGFTCTGAAPSVCSGICGDGETRGAETCDDSNTAAGDGCSATCTIESGFSCTGTPSTCSGICGDGLIKGSETCDDSNTTAGDGCSATCAIESNFRCTGAPSTCQSYLDFVKALADTNTDGTVSEMEALALTFAIADAPNQPYNTVSQYDIDNDGDVDNTDVALIIAQLDILAP